MNKKNNDVMNIEEQIKKIKRTLYIWETADIHTISKLTEIDYETLVLLLPLMVTNGDIYYVPSNGLKYTLEKYL